MRWTAVLGVTLGLLVQLPVASQAATASASPQRVAAKRLNALIDVGKINVELIPITTPGPGPPFKIHVDMGDQGIATPTVITLYHQGEPVGRGLVTNGAVDILPQAPVGRTDLTTVFEQDRALPAQKAVEN